jgi:5'-nucleotidase (lipoprotein e(P4) family)
MVSRSTIRLGAAALVFATACTAPASTTTGAPAPAPTVRGASERPLPRDVRWVRNSAEYRAIVLQTYRVAGERVRELARGLDARSWAVILDADETVLDNSEYQRRRAVLDSGFTPATWNAWISERAAVAVPGAVAFIRDVRTMGGRIAIVTNRDENQCEDTRANLRSIGVEADLVLCQPPGEGTKNPRFERVQSGTAAPGVPALRVVAWVGDNIQDFPRLTQGVRGDSTALSEFGRRYFVLPNPMYGSWERL